MFLPVGSTPGLRMGSPPGPGSMYWPSSASTSAPNSLSATTWRRQNSRYSNKGSSILSSDAFVKPAAARALRDLLEELDVLQDALVGVAVDLLELAALGVREDARQPEDLVLGPVDLRDGDERGDGLLGRRRDTDRVQAHGQ